MSRFRLQGAALGKDIGNVYSEHLRPQIAVVACCVAATPYVIEVTRTVAWWNLGIKQPDLSKCLCFEVGSFICRGDGISRKHVPSQVEAGGSEILAKGVGRLEVDALQHALLQLGRHSLACLIVAGIVVEDLRNRGKRFIEL